MQSDCYFIIGIYNSLIGLRNQVDNAWSQIDVQLKRRYDLIPNLVETVKGYMTHEHDTLVQLTEARTNAMAAHDNPSATLAQKEQAENALSGTLKTLFAVTERPGFRNPYCGRQGTVCRRDTRSGYRGNCPYR